MKQLNLPTTSPQVQVIDGKAITTSLDVAKFFDKEHAKVTRSIQTLLKQEPEWGVANFGETFYVNEQNEQEYIYYTMSRDGFVMLVMSYTGEKARKIKLDYIQAFNRMEAQLLQGHEPPAIDAPASKEQRRRISVLVEYWATDTHITRKEAWQKLHAHFDIGSVDELKSSQILPVVHWVEEQINIQTAKVLLRDCDVHAGIITDMAMQGVYRFGLVISLGETVTKGTDLALRRFYADISLHEETAVKPSGITFSLNKR